MHELSIAGAIVREVEAALASRPAVRVTTVRLRIGRLSGIVPMALEYGLGFVTPGTRLDGATVEIEDEPVVIWCRPCGCERTTVGSSVRCPTCDTPSADIRAGRGMQIINVDVDDVPDRSTALPEPAGQERVPA